MGGRVSQSEMDGRGERQSPSAVQRREMEFEASMLPHLAVRHGVSYTAACSNGQGPAAGCEDKGAGTETLVWRAAGGDVGSARHLPRNLTFAHLSEQ